MTITLRIQLFHGARLRVFYALCRKIGNERTFQRTLFLGKSARTLTHFIFAMNVRNNYDWNGVADEPRHLPLDKARR